MTRLVYGLWLVCVFSRIFVLFRFVPSGRKDEQVRVTGIGMFIFKQLRALREKCPGTVALVLIQTSVRGCGAQQNAIKAAFPHTSDTTNLIYC